ncbi:MAG TPA: membrane lipoprotein lipid attachment site-containing protein [Gammaproteobacteria bacterium]|jgi:hypothetical protein
MKRTLYIACIALILAGCSDNKRYETAICALADISGTYADQKQDVARIIKAGLIPNLEPGDSLFFITIDSNSYEEENLKFKLNLDYIPSKANDQKLAFATNLDEFAKDQTRSRYTDISGAMMLCADYLRNTGSGNQAMVIFSDMKEELQPGLKRKFRETEFSAMHIAALNVIKLGQDSTNPEIYRKRLSEWEKRIKGSGAESWDTILDASKIPEYVEQLK